MHYPPRNFTLAGMGIAKDAHVGPVVQQPIKQAPTPAPVVKTPAQVVPIKAPQYMSVAQANAAGASGQPLQFHTQTPRHIIQAYQAGQQGRTMNAQGYIPAATPAPRVTTAPVAQSLPSRNPNSGYVERFTGPEFGFRDDFRFTKEQLIEMRNRAANGATETFERSGEGENGLGPDASAETKATDATATGIFTHDANGTPIPAASAEKTNLLPWAIAAAISYYLFGA